MARQLFISEKYIKENSTVDPNVDMNKILPVIWLCQIQYIQGTLGTPLYNDLLAKIEGDTLAGDDLELVNDYIADALLYWFLYEFQVPLLFNLRNKSTATNNSDHSQPISTKELARLENRFKAKAEFFSQRIDDFLCANSKKFPLYTTFTSSDETRPRDTKSTVSIFLGNSRKPNHVHVDRGDCENFHH